MAAIGRIDLGLAEGEFWRLTPRQFHAYLKRNSEREKQRLHLVQFLATATARAMGQDVNFMEEPPEDREPDPDEFRAWLQARAAPTLPTNTGLSIPEK